MCNNLCVISVYHSSGSCNVRDLQTEVTEDVTKNRAEINSCHLHKKQEKQRDNMVHFKWEIRRKCTNQSSMCSCI